MVTLIVPVGVAVVILCLGHIAVYYLTTQLKSKLLKIEEAIEVIVLKRAHRTIVSALATLNALTVVVVIMFSTVLSLGLFIILIVRDRVG